MSRYGFQQQQATVLFSGAFTDSTFLQTFGLSEDTNCFQCREPIKVPDGAAVEVYIKRDWRTEYQQPRGSDGDSDSDEEPVLGDVDDNGDRVPYEDAVVFLRVHIRECQARLVELRKQACERLFCSEERHSRMAHDDRRVYLRHTVLLQRFANDGDLPIRVSPIWKVSPRYALSYVLQFHWEDYVIAGQQCSEEDPTTTSPCECGLHLVCDFYQTDLCPTTFKGLCERRRNSMLSTSIVHRASMSELEQFWQRSGMLIIDFGDVPMSEYASIAKTCVWPATHLTPCLYWRVQGLMHTIPKTAAELIAASSNNSASAASTAATAAAAGANSPDNLTLRVYMVLVWEKIKHMRFTRSEDERWGYKMAAQHEFSAEANRELEIFIENLFPARAKTLQFRSIPFADASPLHEGAVFHANVQPTHTVRDRWCTYCINTRGFLLSSLRQRNHKEKANKKNNNNNHNNSNTAPSYIKNHSLGNANSTWELKAGDLRVFRIREQHAAGNAVGAFSLPIFFDDPDALNAELFEEGFEPVAIDLVTPLNVRE